MMNLGNLLGKSFSEKAVTCRSENLDDPRFAAKFLYAWDKQYRLVGADQFAQVSALKMLSLHGYEPSNTIAAHVLGAYASEKKLICDALEQIADKGALPKDIIANLEILMDTGKFVDSRVAQVEQRAEPAPARQ